LHEKCAAALSRFLLHGQYMNLSVSGGFAFGGDKKSAALS
jgi:hypothetical protein